MPTYDYICDDCAHEFEAFESIKADPQKICPACGKDTLRRKIGPGAAILFKGSGFYITDYRSDSYKEKAKSESGNGSSSSGGEGGKTASSTPAASASSPPPPPPSSGGSPST
jgi:putative FmdB family regulatory protein